MNDNPEHAFSSLLDRSVAMANPDVRDRISLLDHIREVEIGAFQAERGMTQKLRFDVVVEVGLPELEAAVAGDDVDKILSYDAITEAIDRGLTEDRLNLLETLAARIAEDILTSPLAARAFIRIQKLDRGPGALGVEIVRERVPGEPEHVAETTRPCVAFIGHEVLNDARLSLVVDRLVAQGLPLVLCVGFDGPTETANPPEIQRRIDLLSIEQTAWRLAGKDSRLAVVATRTELDWAIKNDQICVWAPSKLILDMANADAKAVVDPVELMQWLAAKLDAAKTLRLGDADPSSKEINTTDNIMLDEFLSPQ